jgi:hypothetical protein
MMNKGHLPREYIGLRYTNPTYMANKASLWTPIFTLKVVVGWVELRVTQLN